MARLHLSPRIFMNNSNARPKTDPFGLTLPSIARDLGGEINGGSVLAPGPGHSPADRSLSVTLNSSAPDGFLVHSFCGDDDIQCKDYVREKCGIPSWSSKKNAGSKADEKDVHYIYRDRLGLPYIRITRRYKNGRKSFPQAHWDGKSWIMGTKDMAAMPYHLPELIGSPDRPIYFVEGEKDSDRLAAGGLLSTTASEGAGAKWKPELTKWFQDRDVYIIPDNDKPGHAHGEKVARALAPVASSVRIVLLPDLPEKGDVSDWLDSGGDIVNFINICESTPLWAANDNSPPSGETPSNSASNFSLTDITEDAVARRFTEISGDTLRYCHDTGAWFEWNDTVWQKNNTQHAFHWARVLARELSEDKGIKVKAPAQKASFASAVERFCRADPTFAVSIDYWDSDPFKLGTPGGTVDLRTGILLPADRADGITKQTSVAPADTAHCPLWLKFLRESTGNDVELIRYLQQWCGYALTGDTREHALVFVYGGGGNGKSVFLNTASGIANQYAVVAAMDTFTASRDSKHPTDLAMLRGARLVTASETEEGKAWAEARIKQMTGGDEISARFMRQDFFTFKPQFKLTIVGNHKPVLHNIDEAARRRFNIIPFTRKPEQPDRELETKLKSEWPGILRWMIDGCLDWRANGLVRPAIIVEATNAYFDEQDLFGHWLREFCDVEKDNPHKWENATVLYKDWKFYAEAAGESPGNTMFLSAALLSRGFGKKRITGGATAYTGLRLKLKGQTAGY
jgi:putative DNA primase/helicase